MSTKPFEYAAKRDYAGTTAAIIGGGVIGASWAALFAANGLNVVISDPDPDIEAKAHARIAAALPTLVALGHAPFDIAERVRFVDDHAHAVAGAFLVQECGPERPGFKQGVWEVVEGAVPADALLCSSSAGIPASLQQTEMRDHTRLLIAHPINPPHRMPLVEVVPTPTTDPEVTARAVAFYDGLGKVTRVIRKEVPGFVVNRLQAAIFRECVALVRGGVGHDRRTGRYRHDLAWGAAGQLGAFPLAASRRRGWRAAPFDRAAPGGEGDRGAQREPRPDRQNRFPRCGRASKDASAWRCSTQAMKRSCPENSKRISSFRLRTIGQVRKRSMLRDQICHIRGRT